MNYEDQNRRAIRPKINTLRLSLSAAIDRRRTADAVTLPPNEIEAVVRPIYLEIQRRFNQKATKSAHYRNRRDAQVARWARRNLHR